MALGFLCRSYEGLLRPVPPMASRTPGNGTGDVDQQGTNSCKSTFGLTMLLTLQRQAPSRLAASEDGRPVNKQLTLRCVSPCPLVH